MDLLGTIRSIRGAEATAEAVPLWPTGSLAMQPRGGAIGIGMMESALDDEIGSLIGNAIDADLLAAYGRTDTVSGDPEVDALLAKVQRRDLNL